MRTQICWGFSLIMLIVRLLIPYPEAAATETPRANAITSKDIRGTCKDDYSSWLRRAGYGAFAYSRSGACGYTWEYETRIAARSGALRNCSRLIGAAACEIVAEKDNNSSRSRDAYLCRFGRDRLALDACNRLLDSSSRDKREMARYFNHRGGVYDLLGDPAHAISDYAAAIKIDGSYGLAYWNSAIVHHRIGEEDAAMLAAGFSLYYFRSTFDDYRADAKRIIEDIAKATALLRARPDDSVCVVALKADKSGFQDSGIGRTYVKEASRRKLSFVACRELLGYPAKVNPFEGSSDVQLCASVLNSIGTSWNDSSNGQLAKAETERRKLTLETCLSKIAAPEVSNTAQNPRNWRKGRLCLYAMKSDRLGWDESAAAKPYRDEALRRNLSVIDCRKAMGFPVSVTPD